MSLTTLNVDMEALRAELRKKEHDLSLAARYGESLLEDNAQIKKELESIQQEYTNAKEVSTQSHLGYIDDNTTGVCCRYYIKSLLSTIACFAVLHGYITSIKPYPRIRTVLYTPII